MLFGKLNKPAPKKKQKPIGDIRIEYLVANTSSNPPKIDLKLADLTCQGISKMKERTWNALSVIHFTFPQHSFSDKGCKIFTTVSFPVLSELNFQGQKISDAGLKHLAKAAWPNLRSMDLQSNKRDRVVWTSLKDYIRSSWGKVEALQFDQVEFCPIVALQIVLCEWSLKTKRRYTYHDETLFDVTDSFGGRRVKEIIEKRWVNNVIR